jgi:protein TonB
VAAIVAVAVALAAIGFPLSKLWLGHQEPAIVHEQPEPAVTPAPAAVPTPAPERSSLPNPAPEPVVVARAETAVPTTAKVPAVVPATPKPAAAARTAPVKPPVKTVRQPVAPPRPAAVAPAASAAAVVPAPEVAPPAAVAAPEPKPEAPAAPIGPFFELRDVNEVPRVLNKVEPQIPDDLRDRQINEVVIVRVLVTQAGHPNMVNLLRRSKAGSSLDDAIISAVRKWTFVPAKRRGEAVSCWYHVGVPVNRAN